MTADNATLVEELSELAVPLHGTAPSTNVAAIDSFCSEFKNRKIISLGEASHGTREFFRIKHRLFRFLVNHMEFRAFGIEEDFNQIRRIDEYVVSGTGDIEKLLAEIAINWPWKTEEVVDLFEWIRGFNESRPTDDCIRVYGFDTTTLERASSALESYLDTVGADIDPSLQRDFDRLTADHEFDDDRETDNDAAERVRSTLVPRFKEYESAWITASSRRTFEFARHQLRLLQQTITNSVQKDRTEKFAFRDEAMTENIEWILDRTSVERIALWAHNAHVQRGHFTSEVLDVEDEIETMGEHLHTTYGEEYYAVGFGLANGEFHTVDPVETELVARPIPDPPSGSIPEILDQLEEPVVFFPTSVLKETPVIADWLADCPLRWRISGSLRDGKAMERTGSDLSEFDGFVFLSETKPTRHLSLEF